MNNSYFYLFYYTSLVQDISGKKKEEDRTLRKAPGGFPEFARFLVEEGIDSISFKADAVAKGIINILEAEGK